MGERVEKIVMADTEGAVGQEGYRAGQPVSRLVLSTCSTSWLSPLFYALGWCQAIYWLAIGI